MSDFLFRRVFIFVRFILFFCSMRCIFCRCAIKMLSNEFFSGDDWMEYIFSDFILFTFFSLHFRNTWLKTLSFFAIKINEMYHIWKEEKIASQFQENVITSLKYFLDNRIDDNWTQLERFCTKFLSVQYSIENEQLIHFSFHYFQRLYCNWIHAVEF